MSLYAGDAGNYKGLSGTVYYIVLYAKYDEEWKFLYKRFGTNDSWALSKSLYSEEQLHARTTWTGNIPGVIKDFDSRASSTVVCECGAEKANQPGHSGWCKKAA